MRHNAAFWNPLPLPLGTLLITVGLAVTAVAVLSLPGHSPLPDSGTPAAVLGASDPMATPRPTPGPDPTRDPSIQAQGAIPAGVYVAPAPPPSPPTPTPIPGAHRPDLSDQLYGLLNNVRTANGLQAVSLSDALIGSAQFYTQYIFVDGNPYQLDHYLAGGPGDRAWARGYCCAVGEILVESEGSAQSMVDLWMNSDPHRGIILDPQYKSIGIACYGGPYARADGNVHRPIVCAAEFGSG